VDNLHYLQILNPWPASNNLIVSVLSSPLYK
jgi:hypothetical protein